MCREVEKLVKAERSEAYAEAYAEAKNESNARSVRNVMAKMAYSAEEAMQLLGLSDEEKKAIRKMGEPKVACKEEKLLFHGSGETVERPQILEGGYTKDFGYGFYCSDYFDQAARWALRRGAKTIYGANSVPTVNVYLYTPSDHLNVLRFSRMTDAWLDFIAACRSGTPHSYDVVEGPMADDEIWNYVEDYLSGRLSREDFWILAKFRYPTHQISFHTDAALRCLTFEGRRLV